MTLLDEHEPYVAWREELAKLDRRIRGVGERIMQADKKRIEQEREWMRRVDQLPEGKPAPPAPVPPDISGDRLLLQRLNDQRRQLNEQGREILAEIREDIEEKAREAEAELFERLRPLVVEVERLTAEYRREILQDVLRVRDAASSGVPTLGQRSTPGSVATADVMAEARREGGTLLRIAPPPRPSMNWQDVEAVQVPSLDGNVMHIPGERPAEFPRGATGGLLGR